MSESTKESKITEEEIQSREEFTTLAGNYRILLPILKKILQKIEELEARIMELERR